MAAVIATRIDDTADAPAAPAEIVVLIERIKARDQAALKALYGLYAQRVRNYALQVLRDEHAAEDVMHEVFVRVWRYAAAFDASKSAKPEAWLFQIARNQAMNEVAHRARMVHMESPDGEEGPASAGASDWQDPRGRLIDHVSARSTGFQQAVQSLPSHYRQVIFLRFQEDMSNPEIARHLGVPVGTVKTWLRRGLIHLRQQLRVDGPAEAADLSREEIS